MLPEELARIKIDKQLSDAGWDIVSRMEYIPNTTSAVKEALMKGSKKAITCYLSKIKRLLLSKPKKKKIRLAKKLPCKQKITP